MDKKWNKKDLSDKNREQKKSKMKLEGNLIMILKVNLN